MLFQLGGQVTVTSTEVWLAYVRGGKAFGGGFSLAASAGNVGMIQLMNPAASGKQALVRILNGSVGANATFFISLWNTALATDDGAGNNLLNGGAAGVCHVRHATVAANVGTTILVEGLQAQLPANISGDWVCELSPGQGVLGQCGSLNVQIQASFMWAEV